MKARIGKCTNYSGCKLAYRNERITVITKDFVCPECGSSLEKIGTRGKTSGVGLMAIGVAVVLICAIAAFIWALLLFEGPVARPTSQATPSPTPTIVQPPPLPTATPTPAPTPTPTPEPTPPPLPTPTPAPSPTPDPVEFGFDMDATQFQKAKEEVLKRIQLIPDLTTNQRAMLIQALARAEGMTLLTRVSFPTGKKELTPADLQTIKKSLANPKIEEAVKNPILVFVVLGFASTSGSEEINMKLSQFRADTVTKALEQQVGIKNLIYPIPMGPSSIFGDGNYKDNQVAEIWLVIP